MCGGNQNTDLNQVTYKLYQVILYRVHSPFVGIFVTITDYISSCDSNYYVITVTTTIGGFTKSVYYICQSFTPYIKISSHDIADC
jgi:uncharacterized protein (DUF1919 family)